MRCWWCQTLVVFTAAVFVQVSAQNALTDTEIQVLLDNGFTIAIHEENSTVTLEHHGYPDHPFEGGWGDNPGNATKVYHQFNLPLNSTNATTKGCAGGLGPIGLAISGAAFYNPYTGFGHNAVEGECAETLDSCKGHPSPDGTYHYHAIPNCLYTGELKDKFLGVALDGYPIYGPMDSSGKTLTSRDLDICHGHLYNGRYMYRATFDFPYILSCFHGEDVKGQNGPPGGGGGPPGGGGGPPGGGGGQRPPRPGARKRRHTFHNLERRQDGNCMQTNNPNWSQEICHVVCENANRDLDNCPSRSGTATTESPMTTNSVTATQQERTLHTRNTGSTRDTRSTGSTASSVPRSTTDTDTSDSRANLASFYAISVAIVILRLM